MDYTLTSAVHRIATISRTPQDVRRYDRLFRRHGDIQTHDGSSSAFTTLRFVVNSNLQTQLIQQDNPYIDLENITLLHFIV